MTSVTGPSNTGPSNTGSANTGSTDFGSTSTVLGAPPSVRAEAEAPMPTWPLTLMVAWVPLWFITGLAGFTWIIFAAPMAASLVRRRNLIVPKGFGFWLVFLVAVVGSVTSIDSAARLSGWVLRFGYYLAATVVLLYILNGRRGVSIWKTARAFALLWLATIIGGYLAFIFGDLSFRSPMAYLMPPTLLENDLIRTMVTPSFADLQDIIGVPVPRPKAPFPYTNSWGSMLAILTPFGLMALSEPRIGLRNSLVKVALAASLVPAVISLNRGLWLSLGLGLVYAAIRFGLTGRSSVIRTAVIAALVLTLTLVVTPLGDLIVTRIATGHSNQDRIELVVDAVEGTIERPVFGWGAPRPNDRNLPSVGTHGQVWFVMFSYGFVGALGYLGTLGSLAWRTRRQTTVAGMWAHVALIIGIIQLPFYLHVPQQMFVMLATAALALRMQAGGERMQAGGERMQAGGERMQVGGESEL